MFNFSKLDLPPIEFGSPAAKYKENLKDRPEMKKEAYKYFFDKYWKDPFRDEGFLDTTERITAKTMRQFIPGKIYTFQYDPIGKDVLDYYDKRPIILCCGQWTAESTGHEIVTGINLNFLPEIARVNTMEYYYQAVKADLEAAYKLTSEKNQVSFIKRALIVLQDLLQLFNVFNKAGQIGYQYAMRNYIVGGRIRQASIVEYDDWEWIPFLLTKDIVGATLAEIHKEYIKQKPVLARKQPPMYVKQEDKRKYNNRPR